MTDSFLSSQTERRSEEVKIFEVFSARSGWPALGVAQRAQCGDVKLLEEHRYQEEKLSYENSGTIITQRSLTNLGGEIEYQNPKNNQEIIDIIIYKDNLQISGIYNNIFIFKN